MSYDPWAMNINIKLILNFLKLNNILKYLHLISEIIFMSFAYN